MIEHRDGIPNVWFHRAHTTVTEGVARWIPCPCRGWPRLRRPRPRRPLQHSLTPPWKRRFTIWTFRYIICCLYKEYTVNGYPITWIDSNSGMISSITSLSYTVLTGLPWVTMILSLQTCCSILFSLQVGLIQVSRLQLYTNHPKPAPSPLEQQTWIMFPNGCAAARPRTEAAAVAKSQPGATLWHSAWAREPEWPGPGCRNAPRLTRTLDSESVIARSSH